MLSLPKTISLLDQAHYRIIPSVFPTIHFFEDLVSPDEMEILFEIESLTNERLRQEAGDIYLVPKQDRVCGPGSSVVMAAFTHISTSSPSRFTDGTYGVYYASLSRMTAIHETVYHREQFMRATREEACELTMRVYEGKIKQALYDIRSIDYHALHHASDYTASQTFAKQLRDREAYGIIYHSVRHHSGTCLALLRPPATSNPKQTAHLRYVWDGQKITGVFDAQSLIHF